MPDTPDDARLTLAIASEPGDRITGTLLAAVGATETLRLITSDTPLPGVVDPVEGGIWRGRRGSRRPAVSTGCGSTPTGSGSASSPRALPGGPKGCPISACSPRLPCGPRATSGC